MTTVTKEAAEKALLVQDACNLRAVVRSFAEVIQGLSGLGTDEVAAHPIVVMYASKVASLTACDSPSVFAVAYEATCRAATGGGQ